MSDKGGAPLISVTSPVYRAEKIVAEFVKRVTEELSKFCDNFELVLVEDGSPDDSWGKIEEQCAKNPKVKGVRLSRNFGQHNAVRAGVEVSRGEYVVIMDCDLQDDPRYLRELYRKAKEGFDIVFTRKRARHHSTAKNLASFIFHKVFNLLSDTHTIDPYLSGYSIMSRKVAREFCRFKEPNKAYITILQWLGFRHAVIEVEHLERFEGKSSYTFSKLLRHALAGLTANSDRLLHLAIFTGLLFFMFAVGAVIFLTVSYFVLGAMPGWTSLIAALLLCTGVVLMTLGIFGIYLGKVFEQVRERPLYVIEKILNAGGG